MFTAQIYCGGKNNVKFSALKYLALKSDIQSDIQSSSDVRDEIGTQAHTWFRHCNSFQYVVQDMGLWVRLEPGYPSNSGDQQLTCKLHGCCPRDIIALGP